MKWDKKKDIIAVMVGHGTMTNGIWDSGSAYGKYTEAALMLPIVKAAVALLRKSGIRVVTDADTKNNMNMTATVAKANKTKNCKLYISVHCDYKDAKSGIMYYYGSDNGKKFGDAVSKYCAKAMGLKFKGGKKDLAKYEVHVPTMTSIIYESGAIKADLKVLRDHPKKYGRAIAKSICKYLGVPVYVSTRTKLLRQVAKTVAYMNKHHFKYDMQYKDCGTSWAKAKKTKKSNCATMICYAMQQMGLLKAGQIFWITGTKIKCVGKGTRARLKSEFKITHPKKSPKGAKLKKGVVCGYSPYHTQLYAGLNKAKKPIWYSWGGSDVGDKQPKRKKSYDTKKVMTVLSPK